MSRTVASISARAAGTATHGSRPEHRQSRIPTQRRVGGGAGDCRDVGAQGERCAFSRSALEMLIAGNEIGMEIGLTHTVAVFDLNMHRLMKRIGCAGEPLGPPRRIGHLMCIAVSIEMGEEADIHLRSIGNITGDVIERRPKIQKTQLAA